MKQKRLNKTEKQQLFELYSTGNYTGADLSKIFPISTEAINALLRRHNYTPKSQSELQRKYYIQENFFDKIDCQENAYVLGLLYADGYNNTDRNSVSLSLMEDDKNLLQNINNIIQPGKPIQNVEHKSNNYNSKPQCRLVMANKHISEKLTELGCGKAKTKNLKFPSEEQVPKHLQRHFIRGYFDGDGSISGDKQKQISIVGTEEFLLKLQEILMEELGFTKTKLDNRHPERNTNIRSIRYCGLYQCLSFGEWLYDGATLYMERKYKKFVTAKNILSQGMALSR